MQVARSSNLQSWPIVGLLSGYRRLNKLNFIQGKLVNGEEDCF